MMDVEESRRQRCNSEVTVSSCSSQGEVRRVSGDTLSLPSILPSDREQHVAAPLTLPRHRQRRQSLPSVVPRGDGDGQPPRASAEDGVGRSRFTQRRRSFILGGDFDADADGSASMGRSFLSCIQASIGNLDDELSVVSNSSHSAHSHGVRASTTTTTTTTTTTMTMTAMPLPSPPQPQPQSSSSSSSAAVTMLSSVSRHRHRRGSYGGCVRPGAEEAGAAAAAGAAEKRAVFTHRRASTGGGGAVVAGLATTARMTRRSLRSSYSRRGARGGGGGINMCAVRRSSIVEVESDEDSLDSECDRSDDGDVGDEGGDQGEEFNGSESSFELPDFLLDNSSRTNFVGKSRSCEQNTREMGGGGGGKIEGGEGKGALKEGERCLNFEKESNTPLGGLPGGGGGGSSSQEGFGGNFSSGGLRAARDDSFEEFIRDDNRFQMVDGMIMLSSMVREEGIGKGRNRDDLNNRSFRTIFSSFRDVMGGLTDELGSE